MALTSAVSVLANGSYPGTTAPSGLAGNVVSANANKASSVDVMVTVTVGAGTITLCGWNDKALKWFPIGDVTVDATTHAVGGVGYNLGRFSPGSGFTAFALWHKVATTVGAAYITVATGR